MQRSLTMFDLGCGLGGASAAMRDRGWTVYRIDRMRDVRADRYCDLRSLLALPQGLDLIWCSTSCQQFTVSVLPYGNLAHAKSKPIDLSVELHVRDLIERARPRFWLVENVLASRKWLSTIFGPVRARTGGHCIWGNVPLMLAPIPAHKMEHWRSWRGRKRHLALSMIPYEISAAVAETVERLTADEEPSCRKSM